MKPKFVTMLLNIGRQHIHASPRPISFYLDSIQHLKNSLPEGHLTCYGNVPGYFDQKLEFTDLISLVGADRFNRLESIRCKDGGESKGLQGESSWYHALTHAKVFLLNREWARNPSLETLYWIDAGLYGHRLITPSLLSSAATQEGFHIVSTTWGHGWHGIGLERIQSYPKNGLAGGLFGGGRRDFEDLFEAYVSILDTCLHEEAMPLDEDIFVLLNERIKFPMRMHRSFDSIIDPESKRTLSPTILIAVCSCHQHRDRRQAIRETWARRLPPGVEVRFFAGKGEHDEREVDLDIVDANDGYDHLPSKVFSFFRHALRSYQFDFIFKCDDDTYVSLDRLVDLVDEHIEFTGDESLSQGYASGGAGYLISRNLVQVICESPDIPLTGPEDVIVTRSVIENGITPVASPLLRWNNKDYPRSDNHIITSHWCCPTRMKAIHSILHKIPAREISAKHAHWTDVLRFYDDGVFARATAMCAGRWERNSQGILLNWFDHQGEILREDISDSKVSTVDPAIHVHPPGETDASIR